jgi:hypothetical protein
MNFDKLVKCILEDNAAGDGGSFGSGESFGHGGAVGYLFNSMGFTYFQIIMF